MGLKWTGKNYYKFFGEGSTHRKKKVNPQEETMNLQEENMNLQEENFVNLLSPGPNFKRFLIRICCFFAQGFIHPIVFLRIIKPPRGFSACVNFRKRGFSACVYFRKRGFSACVYEVFTKQKFPD